MPGPPRRPFTARTVKSLPAGRWADAGCPGLYCVVEPGANGLRRRWLYRYALDGQSRSPGLGSCDLVPLAEARAKATALRRLVRIDRVDVAADRQRDRLARKSGSTVGAALDVWLAKESPAWRDKRREPRLRSMFARYCKPLEKRAIEGLTAPDIADAVRIPWEAGKPAAAEQLRALLYAVVRHARAHGARLSENVASKELVMPLLASQPKRQTRHHPAIPLNELPAFVTKLRARQGGRFAGRFAGLEFCLLTAARPAEVQQARWEEIDFAAKTWTCPASRMKLGIEHIVPLVPRAIEVLAGLPRSGDFIFGGAEPLSEKGLTRALQSIYGATAGAHGTGRGGLKTWATDHGFAKADVELALAHGIPADDLERAYYKGTGLARRRTILEGFARFLDGAAPASADVIALEAARRA